MQLKTVHLRLSRTQQDLEVTRRQKSELETLVSELPEIFERKFKERCAPILERQRLLIEENQWLRQTLQHVLPGFNPQQRALMPGPDATPAPAPPPAPTPETAAAAAKPTNAPSKPGASSTPRRGLSWPKRPLAGRSPLPHTRRQLVLVGGLVGLLSLGGTLGYLQLRRASPSPAETNATAATGATQKQVASSEPAAASPAADKALGADEVALLSNQENWVEVRNGAGTYLFVGLLKGEKRFALNKGLQVFAGRPDLLTIRQGKGPARQLGQVSDVAWVTIQPDGTASGSGPASSGAAPAPR